MLSPSKGLISHKTPLEKIDSNIVGGKGWNLFRLLHFGFPVPRWLVISSRIFDEAVRGWRKSINKILSNINFKNQKSLDHASLQIREMILQLELKRQFFQELLPILEEIFEKGSSLAIRSSVVGEDSS
jgi:phosphoenolpyruvate synthase/pyruvate phosphate dikinase